jgi:translation elongation factor EF-Tu-like GTPase
MDNLFDDPKLLEQTARELRNLLDNMKTNGESLVSSVKLQKLKEINEFSKKIQESVRTLKGH